MLGIEELKDEIEVTEKKVECPVKRCTEKVDRKRQNTRASKDAKYQCRLHEIFISPSSFIYPDMKDNLLWNDPSDSELLQRILLVKRECRMEYDNSEDAVSWNVFRYLERNNLIEGYLSSVTGTVPRTSEVIYWSYSQMDGTCSCVLNKARTEFGEKIEQSSEPDIIIITDDALFIIEAKFGSGSKDPPKKERKEKRYLTGGENWFFKVFSADFQKVAIEFRFYELLRFWLLGTWMAEQLDLDFYLINLVLEGKETSIESDFGSLIKETQRRKFLRVTWESIYKYISNEPIVRESEIILRYFRNKTLGYKKRKGIYKLREAFSISDFA